MLVCELPVCQIAGQAQGAITCQLKDVLSGARTNSQGILVRCTRGQVLFPHTPLKEQEARQCTEREETRPILVVSLQHYKWNCVHIVAFF